MILALRDTIEKLAKWDMCGILYDKAYCRGMKRANAKRNESERENSKQKEKQTEMLNTKTNISHHFDLAYKAIANINKHRG